MNRASVLHVSTVHPPYDLRIFEKEACGLARSGFRVDVAMTTEHNGFSGGVNTLALGGFKGSRLRRIARNWRALWHMVRPYDIVHVHDPELLVTGLVAALVGRRVIYDVHEFHRRMFVTDDTTTTYWIPRPLRPLIGAAYCALERLALPRFAGVVISMPAMREIYEQFVPSERLALVRNYPQADSPAFAFARHGEPPLTGPYIVQTGGASYVRGFHVLVAAAEILRERGIAAPIVIPGNVAVGSYSKRERADLMERARRADVRVLGRIPYHEMLRWAAHARAGIACYLEHENARHCFATKIFEYFVLGLPVIVSDFGVNAEIVKRHQAGIAVVPDDPQSYAEAIEALVSRPQLHARLAAASARAAKSYDFSKDFGNLVLLYERAMGDPARVQGNLLLCNRRLLS